MSQRGTGGLSGGPDQSKGLDGVAPKVLDAFLSAQARQPSASDELAQGLFAERSAPPPKAPEAPGAFTSRPTAEILAESRARIRELVAQAKREAPPSGPPAPLLPPAATPGPEPAASSPSVPAGPTEAPPAAAGEVSPPGPGAKPGGADLLAAFGRASGPRPSQDPSTPPPQVEGGPGAPSLKPGSAPPGALSLPSSLGKPKSATGDLKNQFMAMRQGIAPVGEAPTPQGGAGPSGPMKASDALKLAQLGMRQQAQASVDAEAAKASAAKVEALVTQRMGAEGAKALKDTFTAIQDAALAGKLQDLSVRVNQLVPGVDVVGLGKDVGSRMVVNSLNPVVAMTVAVAESAQRLEKLRQWDQLSPKERLANVAHLSGNLAEILGALTPPPLNVGVQALGAGMALVGLASENMEVDEVSRLLGRSEALKRGAAGAGVAAARVQAAWEDLADRLEASRAKKPKLPAPLRSLFGSEAWGKLKQWEVTAPLVEGTENVAHNLSRKVEGQVASVEATWQDLKGKVAGSPQTKAPQPRALKPKRKVDEGAEAAPSEIDRAAEQADRGPGSGA